MANCLIKRSGGGVDCDNATATAADVLEGKTFGGKSSDELIRGTMTNRGTYNKSVTLNSSVIIPAGYHNGTGKITYPLSTKAGGTYTPKASDQTIPVQGYYLTSDIIRKGDSLLKPENIVFGKKLFGITGNYRDSAHAVKVFTSNTTYVVPANVYKLDIFCVGGGGAGGRGRVYTNEDEHAVGGGGGAGGHTTTKTGVTVTPGESLTITIGAGGAGDRGRDGSATSLKRGDTVLCEAAGGSGPGYFNDNNPGTSGTGSGGYGGYASYYAESNGSNGGDGVYAFGDSSINGIKYGAGGGGGYAARGYYMAGSAGKGGTTGGGEGGSWDSGGTGGQAGTGAGGGGGGGSLGLSGGGTFNGGNGGSGAILIRASTT